MLDGLANSAELGAPGTRVSVTIAVPDAQERTWSWVREEKPT